MISYETALLFSPVILRGDLFAGKFLDNYFLLGGGREKEDLMPLNSLFHETATEKKPLLPEFPNPCTPPFTIWLQ